MTMEAAALAATKPQARPKDNFLQLLARLDDLVTARPWLVLIAFVPLWTIYAVVSNGAADIHTDTAEAYSWGREMMWGYYKHPPFWSWIAHDWFAVFPIKPWSAYLLSTVNVALGLYFVRKVAAYFLADEASQWSAALLLALMPVYSFLTMLFNANTIQLSVWPATAWAFLAMMDKLEARRAALAGLLMACALLSKYNALLFLGCLFFASLVHPNRRKFWASSLPFFAALGFLPLTLMHFLWLVQNNFLPFHYFHGEEIYPFSRSIPSSLGFLVAMVLYSLPAMLALAVAARSLRIAWPKLAMMPVLAILTFGPTATSAVACAALQTKCSALWGMQNLFTVPIFMITLLPAFVGAVALRRIWRINATFLAVTLVISPIVAVATFEAHTRAANSPRTELALKLTHWWHQNVGGRWKIVGGNDIFSMGAAFSSPDHPVFDLNVMPLATPWITPALAKAQGALYICEVGDAVCIAKGKEAAGPQAELLHMSAVKRLWGLTAPRRHFVIVVQRPQAPAKAT
ncbi:MAG: glycosyltransferase family 39 protein [Hyphomicrobiales bacterium]|nr:glycosyltransferase family 39 protein [Hyphomicrobiales bacterium]